MIGSPSNAKELFLFGGEFYNGSLATFFNDLYVYNIERDDWRKITSPNTPLPRSGHAWCRGGNSGGIYLFGGEFSSPKQGTFYHYNDFWKLEPATREWVRIDPKGKSPPARSGHRLVYHKNYIVLFGGFQDTSSQTKYLQDLWIYDCQNFAWHSPVLPPATQKPDPRSSFSFHPNEAGAVLYGGYSRVKGQTNVGKQMKGGSQASKLVLKPTIHQDSWLLRIVQPTEGVPTTPPSIRWERRKKPLNAPNPPRAGATQAYHKGRGIMFGGVHDVEESEEGMESEFFNQLFAWNLERNRFFPLALRRPKAVHKKQTEDRSSKRARGRADEADLLRNLAALESKGISTESDPMDGGAMDHDREETPSKPDKKLLDVMPHPRFNAHLAVQNDVLYVLGGTYEHGDREYTFDEMHAIDLGKLDGVQEIYKRELDNWLINEDESGDSDDESGEGEEDSEDEDREDDDENQGGVTLLGSADLVMPTDSEIPSQEPCADGEEAQQELPVNDDRPHPRPFESLREFFTRTSNAWQELVQNKVENQSNPQFQSIKELRKIAFELAETKWWDCREEITAEEDRQEEAGIGEVISIADRSMDAGSSGRRR